MTIVSVSPLLMMQDSVIFERLQSHDPFRDTTEELLKHFAEEGLRTLCMAEVDLTEDTYRVHWGGEAGKGRGIHKWGRLYCISMHTWWIITCCRVQLHLWYTYIAH